MVSSFDQAAERLWLIVQYLTPEGINELTAYAERLVTWQMAMQQAEVMAQQPHERLSDEDEVTYQHLLNFTLAIGISPEFATRLWTSFFKKREALRQRSFMNFREMLVKFGKFMLKDFGNIAHIPKRITC